MVVSGGGVAWWWWCVLVVVRISGGGGACLWQCLLVPRGAGGPARQCAPVDWSSRRCLVVLWNTIITQVFEEWLMMTMRNDGAWNWRCVVVVMRRCGCA